MSSIGSIDRSVAILDLFIQGEYELSPNDVAKKTGISISTAFRTMSSLCENNVLTTSTSRGKYRLSSKILDLSRSYMSNLNLIDVALPHMKKLQEETGETIGLYTMDESKRVCVAKVDGDKDIRRVLSLGSRGPIYAGSPSKALLAFLPDTKIKEILKPIEMVKITKLTKTTIEEIMKDLLKVRKDGYSTTKGEEIEHSFAISAPIRDHNANIISALAIVGITIYFTAKLEKEYATLVKQAAAEISFEMGYSNNGRKSE